MLCIGLGSNHVFLLPLKRIRKKKKKKKNNIKKPDRFGLIPILAVDVTPTYQAY